LAEVLGAPQTLTEEIALDWMARDGKRWRPFLTACAFKAMTEDPEADPPEDLRRLAIAVECFHKASLIHDDIEDNDAERYGKQSLHAEHGVAVALNCGDFLLGEGYRLLAGLDVAANIRSEMVRAAAEGQRRLCVGQGEELTWARNPHLLSVEKVLQIFSLKTAPAFEVALRLGTLLSGSGGNVSEVIRKYSEALGIAYQIRDDLDDLMADRISDLAGMRPSLPPALAAERAKGEAKAILHNFWNGKSETADAGALAQILADCKVEDRCRGMLEAYKEEAVRSLASIEHSSLKGLLRRVIGKIFSVEIKGWCSEFETRDAPGGEIVAKVAS
jgi:geranylgeranyl pyrophosphate synthase